MPAESRITAPPAPDILGRAITHEGDKYFPYETAFSETVEALTPVIEALSDPEVYSRSTTYINGVQQEDLWRRTLDFSPRFMFQDKEYAVGVMQVVDKENKTRGMVFHTGVEHDSVFLGGVYYDPKELHNPHKVSTKGKEYANGGEAKELVELAGLVAEEAPKQAFLRGYISESWMDRFARIDKLGDEGPYEQGVPRERNNIYGNPEVYELILGHGTRIVAHVIEGGNAWIEDVRAERPIDEAEVAAWRKLGVILPEYYSRAKYPSHHEHEAPTQSL